MINKPFPALFEALKQRCDMQLDIRLPKHIADTEHSVFHKKQTLCQAMRYTALNGGKRIRPILVYATGLAFDLPLEQLDLAACAVEVIHSGSLIHDDLPAMDDDALRRGKPTCHLAFDEATAILAGDGLQCYAYELLAEQTCEPHKTVAMLKTLAHAHGSQGITGGQSLDILADTLNVNEQDLMLVHHLKTGGLLSAAVKLALILAAPADNKVVENIILFASHIGLAFQIIDDILDVESSTEILGKPSKSDQNNSKSTYPSTLGLAEAKTKANTVYEQALGFIQNFDHKFDFLRYVSDYLAKRIS